MRIFWCLAVLALMAPAPAEAEQTLTDITAFQQADAASFYDLDACGDTLDGRLYRRALMEKFRSCPFADAAGAKFARWSQAQFRHSRDILQKMVDDVGGLPTQLPGMTRTCHEQLASPDVMRLHDVLQKYASGEVTAAAVLPAACDAESLQQ